MDRTHGGVMVSTGVRVSRKASRRSIGPLNGGKHLNAEENFALAA